MPTTEPTVDELADIVRGYQAEGLRLGDINAAEQLVAMLLEAWEHSFVPSKVKGRLCVVFHERQAHRDGVFGALTERLLELGIDVADLSMQMAR